MREERDMHTKDTKNNHIIDLNKGYEISGGKLGDIINSSLEMLGKYGETNVDIPVVAVVPLDDAVQGSESNKVKALYNIRGMGRFGSEGEIDAITLVLEPAKLVCLDDDQCECEHCSCEKGDDFEVDKNRIRPRETWEEYMDRLYDELFQILGFDEDEE